MNATRAAEPVDWVRIFQDLESRNPSWRVVVGVPEGSGWMRGVDLCDVTTSPFTELLERIGQRLVTSDRRIMAASFALRFGWSAGLAVGPYLIHGVVPDVSLENVSLLFRPDTFFERTALHVAREAAGERPHTPATLREALLRQAEPVVRALHGWSGFAVRGIWGQVTSSWASQVITVFGELGDQTRAMPVLEELFGGDDEACRMRPRLHLVTVEDATHVFQRRASCCRYYLLPKTDLCASCPLVTHEERLVRNREWMKAQLQRRRTGGGSKH